MSATIWISPEVLNWHPMIESYSTRAGMVWQRAYQHWHHAERLLGLATTEFHRIDIITTLKRALDVRLKLLASVYGFRRMPLSELPSGSLEQLAFLGVLRPLFIGRLLEIRNRIEHEDAEPPTIDHCAELVDVTWYFLRSTDSMVRQVATMILIDESGGTLDAQFFLSLKVNVPDNWELNIRGWLPDTWVRNDNSENWIAVQAQKCERFGEKTITPTSPEGIVEARRHKPGDISLAGRVVGPSRQLLALYQFFLGVR